MRKIIFKVSTLILSLLLTFGSAFPFKKADKKTVVGRINTVRRTIKVKSIKGEKIEDKISHPFKIGVTQWGNGWSNIWTNWNNWAKWSDWNNWVNWNNWTNWGNTWGNI